MDRIATGKAQLIGTRTVEDVREDFPILDRRIGGKALAYLDNAATSQKPREVLDAIRVYYERGNANVHRALHTLGEEATAAFEEARKKIQRFVNARKGLRDRLHARHHGVDQPRGLFVGGAVPEGGGRGAPHRDGASQQPRPVAACLPAARVPAAVHPRGAGRNPRPGKGGALVGPPHAPGGLTHVSNVLGTINDVKAVAALAHSRGALVLVDGAQAVPHFRVDVQDLDCDFYAFSSHKMCGPMGIGVLYGKEKILDSMPPWMGGGEMIRAVWPEKSTWNDLPWKFEAGTPNVGGRGGPGRGHRLPAQPGVPPDRRVGRGAGGGTPRNVSTATSRALTLYGAAQPAARCSPSPWETSTPTTWRSSWTAKASRCGRATTAPSP